MKTDRLARPAAPKHSSYNDWYHFFVVNVAFQHILRSLVLKLATPKTTTTPPGITVYMHGSSDWLCGSHRALTSHSTDGKKLMFPPKYYVRASFKIKPRADNRCRCPILLYDWSNHLEVILVSLFAGRRIILATESNSQKVNAGRRALCLLRLDRHPQYVASALDFGQIVLTFVHAAVDVLP